VKWAGDLNTHPLVLLARARQEGGSSSALGDARLAEQIEESRHWAPPAMRGGWIFKLWFEQQYLAGVQAHYLADTPREAEELRSGSGS